MSVQTISQDQLFANFLASVNMEKLTQRFAHFHRNNNQDGKYNEYVYLLRVLRINGISLAYRNDLETKVWDYMISIVERQSKN